jgi:hypothetical protein
VSKTITEIGIIVGGAAIAIAGALIPGAQPFIGVGISVMLAGIGMALRTVPKRVGSANVLAVSSGPGPRRVLYGQFQCAGLLTYSSFPPGANLLTGGNPNTQYLQLVYTLTGHEIESFDAVSVDGVVYSLGAAGHCDLEWETTGPGYMWHLNPSNSGSRNDFYWEHMFFEFDFGRNSSAQPFPNLAGIDPAWTSACIQQNCAKVHVILQYDPGYPNVYSNGEIPNIQFLITGKKLIDPRIVTAWQPSNSYLQYQYIVDNLGNLWIQTAGSGTSGATRPNFEGSIGTPPVTLSDGGASWTYYGFTLAGAFTCTSAAPQGNIYGGRLVNDAWLNTNTFAEYQVIEAPIGYLQMQTSASGTTGAAEPAWSTTLGGATTDGTTTWTCLGRSPHAINPSNPALVVNDYLQNTDWGLAAVASTVDESSVIAAANVCEEQALIVYCADGGKTYENLYACDGLFDQSSVRGDVLSALVGSMAGWVIPPGDLWHVFAGSYITPTISLGDNDLRSALKGDFRISRRDAANGIKGTFTPGYLATNPALQISLTNVSPLWQACSFPAYQANGDAGKPNYILEDGGQIIWQDLHLEFTKSLWMAQRLAKITLMRLRFQQTLTLQCKLTAFQLEAGDTLYFTHERWGITSQSFEILQCSLVLDDSNKDAPALAVDIVARETSASVYNFQPPTSASNYGEYSPYGITGVMVGTE